MATNYIQQYKEYHQNNTHYQGDNLAPQIHHILELIQITESQTLLDYGCGKGNQWTNNILPVTPTLYDPAVPQYENKPTGTFDGVISTDVMEHIPEEQISEVFREISTYATRFVFLCIATDPAIAVLPNGENAHCTLKPLEWWVDEWWHSAVKDNLAVHIKTYGQYEGYQII